jgi:hypothetical protein
MGSYVTPTKSVKYGTVCGDDWRKYKLGPLHKDDLRFTKSEYFSDKKDKFAQEMRNSERQARIAYDAHVATLRIGVEASQRRINSLANDIKLNNQGQRWQQSKVVVAGYEMVKFKVTRQSYADPKQGSYYALDCDFDNTDCMPLGFICGEAIDNVIENFTRFNKHAVVYISRNYNTFKHLSGDDVGAVLDENGIWITMGMPEEKETHYELYPRFQEKLKDIGVDFSEDVSEKFYIGISSVTSESD